MTSLGEASAAFVAARAASTLGRITGPTSTHHPRGSLHVAARDSYPAGGAACHVPGLQHPFNSRMFPLTACRVLTNYLAISLII